LSSNKIKELERQRKDGIELNGILIKGDLAFISGTVLAIITGQLAVGLFLLSTSFLILIGLVAKRKEIGEEYDKLIRRHVARNKKKIALSNGNYESNDFSAMIEKILI
jgi:hypothetical protein